MNRSRKIFGKYRRKPIKSQATSALINYYGQFLMLDPNTASTKDFVTAMAVGYFHAGGHDDPDAHNEELIRDREAGKLGIKKYSSCESAKTELQNTLKNALLMIRVATDASCKATVEFYVWLLETLQNRSFFATTWKGPGNTRIKVTPRLSGNQDEFKLIFAIYRMGLVDAIVNAFTTTTAKQPSNGSYYLGVCPKCGLLCELTRPNQKYHKPCKPKYLRDPENPRKKYELTHLGQRNIVEGQRRRREHEKMEAELLKKRKKSVSRRS
ncbi:MAG: hypothetical protein HQM09_21490 [Candidatus Riflebacteria bacterium]|nr:hypothetical protein [Candidatus Riflebacteria bacterium]